MSLLQRLNDALRGGPVTAPRNEVTVLSLGTGDGQWDGFYSGPVAGLPAPTEHSLMRLSAAYACINLIAGSIAALPVPLYNVADDGERTQRHGDALWWILNEEFSPRWNAGAGWEYLGLSLLTHGDAFARILRGRGGAVVGLEPVHPYRVEVMVTPDRMRLVYRVAGDPRVPGDVPVVLDQDDMIHVPGFGFDGRRGLSPLRYALASTASVAQAAQDFSGRFFANSAVPSGVLSTDQPIDAKKAQELQDAWEAKYRGDGHGRIAVTGYGAKFQSISLSSEDAQLLETRRFQVEEIARIYGVPPFMIGANDKTTSFGAGIEAMGTGFVRYTLMQHITKIEKELNRKLFRRASPMALFDTSELTAASMTELFAALRVGVGRAGEPGFMSQNEARAKLKLRRSEGGDEIYSGGNRADMGPPETAAPAAATEGSASAQ